jgi:hypothetical protein
VETELRGLRCHDNSRDETKKRKTHLFAVWLLTPDEVRFWPIQEREPTLLSATKQRTFHDNVIHYLLPVFLKFTSFFPGFDLRRSLLAPTSGID